MHGPTDPESVTHRVRLNPYLIMPCSEAIILRAQATSETQAAIAATWVWEEKTVTLI